MSDLGYLPPSVDKLWITVDFSLKTVVNRLRLPILLKQGEGKVGDYVTYAQR